LRELEFASLENQEGRFMSRSNKILVQKIIAISAMAVIATTLMCPPAAAHQATSKGTAPTPQATGKRFSSPEDAAAALYAAARRNDESNLRVILGPDAQDLVAWTDDANESQQQRALFAQKYERMHRLVKEPDQTVALYVGAENRPLPVPLVQDDAGWYFDSKRGRQKIRYRRIGRNEMEALEVCHTLVDAEWDYYANQHRFTARFISDIDSHDGLYWSSPGNAPKSPIGPYLAHAGVSTLDTTGSQPLHGYYYHIILQGSDGVAVEAFPAQYRSSGIVTFLVSQDGTAYEKDFGDQMGPFVVEAPSSSPDSSWKKVE
jgi:hypothetical protein